ncbi:hypothetical protein ACHAWC_000667, partial [Mediolabrus comicus]
MFWRRRALFIAAGGRHNRRGRQLVTTTLLLGSIGGAFVAVPRDDCQKATSLQQKRQHGSGQPRLSSCSVNSVSLLATSSSTNSSSGGGASSSTFRSYSTKADEYFEKHSKVPLPRIIHDNLDSMLQRQMQQLGVERRQDDTHEEERSASSSKKILIIGDVHGCLSELKLLIEKATHECNNSQNFFAIILVGDLVNKGPFSAEVIQYVRSQQQEKRNLFAVRGNHDDAALAAALGDEERAQKPRYNWTKQLSDEDVEWMADLPYTITIPSSYLQSDDNRDTNDANKQAEHDVIVVHAGLLPNVSLSDQRPKLMTTIRNISHLDTSDGSDGNEERIENIAVAKAWKGPEFVIFGHDARRGLQQEEYAIGLDTGCVYGKQLTGIILPERHLVSV